MPKSRLNFESLGFDLDGTICNSLEGIDNSYRHVLKSLKLEGANNYRSAIGKPLILGLESLGIPKSLSEEGVRLFREYYAESGIFEAHLYPGIRELLLRLHAADIPLYIVTAKPTLYAKKVIDHFELAHLFQSVNGLEMNSQPVSKIEQIDVLVKKSGIDRGSFCFVGDRRQDIEAGKKNGADTIGVAYGYGDENELKLAGADFIVHDVNELSMLLQ